jgi:environmental stress-induced protein Ves
MASSAARVFTVLRRSSFAKQPWVNGLGFTHEIAVRTTAQSAAVASLCESRAGEEAKSDPPFLWRLSMADLTAGRCTFSKIPGVNRVLTLLSGELELAIDGGEMASLPLHVPISFPCDVPTESVISRPGYDLNLMWSREHATGKVSLHSEDMRVIPLGGADECDGASGALAFAVAIGGEANVSLITVADDGATEDEAVERVVLGEDDAAQVVVDAVALRTTCGLRVDSGRIALCELFVR